MFLNTYLFSAKNCLQCKQLNINILYNIKKKKKIGIYKKYHSFCNILEAKRGKHISLSFVCFNRSGKCNNLHTLKNEDNYQDVVSDIKTKRDRINSNSSRNSKNIKSFDSKVCKNFDETTNARLDVSANGRERIWEEEEVKRQEDVIDYVTDKDMNEKENTVYDSYDEDDDIETVTEECNEVFEDDIDTLLFTNNLNSSLVGNLWHSSANSLYKELQKNLNSTKENKNKHEQKPYYYSNNESKKNLTEKDIYSKKEETSEYIKKEDNVLGNVKEVSMSNTQGSGLNSLIMDNFYVQESVRSDDNNINFNTVPKGTISTNALINKIYEEEQREAEKLKEFFTENKDNFERYRNSIMCKLNISKELPKKFKHLSKENSNIFNTEINKERYYKKLIDNLDKGTYQEAYYKKKNEKKKKNINYDTIETIKILDIDSLSCNVLNHLFAYKIVKNCSAEICLKIISRIGMYRDKHSQVSYENMINYIGQIINNNTNAEIIALFSRCYETVSIPFLVNYVRKYGTFSRSFIVNLYDKYFKKRLFDFVRYENNMGVRKIPNILTHPYHLSSYIKLMGECSAKKDMYIQLKIKGHVPSSLNLNDLGLTGSNMLNDGMVNDGMVNDGMLSGDMLSGDMLSGDTVDRFNYYLPDEQNNTKTKEININYQKKKKSSDKYIKRPKMYDIILSSEYTGLPIEHFIEKEENDEDEAKFLNYDNSKKKKKKELPKTNNNLAQIELPSEAHELKNDHNTILINKNPLVNKNINVINKKERTQFEKNKKIKIQQSYAIAKDENVIEDLNIMSNIHSIEQHGQTTAYNTYPTEDDVHNIKDDVHNIKDDVHNIEDDVHNIEDDVHNIEDDVHNIEDDVHNIEDDVHKTKNDVHKTTNHIHNNESINFTLEDECDIYMYKKFSKLNKSTLALQNKLVKGDEKKENELTTCLNKYETYEEIDKDVTNQALWELPWKGKMKNSFYFKSRFFKILPNIGWSEIKDISNKYIRPKRKRKKHSITRERALQKKIKINLFKKKILQK
ncbi:conserved protein, unknown function [Hepatocystis sp. ex Piliocolobus tephrosceles]|nr:conserved protein, unknown function [Hepatocystis sp. ex Piliocolobus tephrosceles]